MGSAELPAFGKREGEGVRLLNARQDAVDEKSSTRPGNPPPPDPEEVSRMFGRIAGRYDLVNHLLTGGIDVRWRNRMVRAVAGTRPARVVDLATGSGDVAFALRRALPDHVEITGLDFCRPMLEEAERKKAARRHCPNLKFAFGDILQLPLDDGAADAVTISFGLRNLADRARGLREMRRILKKESGRLFILEFTHPARWMRPFYFPYLRHVLPRLAGCISGDVSAYRYLNTSIEGFPPKEQITEEIETAGFQDVRAHPMTGSIVTLHEARA